MSRYQFIQKCIKPWPVQKLYHLSAVSKAGTTTSESSPLRCGHLDAQPTIPALLELVLNARRYDDHLNARYLYIAEQKKAGNLDIEVEPLPLKHKFSVLTDTTDGADLTEHAKDEQNRYYADYFHVDSIRVRSESSLVSTGK